MSLPTFKMIGNNLYRLEPTALQRADVVEAITEELNRAQSKIREIFCIIGADFERFCKDPPTLENLSGFEYRRILARANNVTMALARDDDPEMRKEQQERQNNHCMHRYERKADNVRVCPICGRTEVFSDFFGWVDSPDFRCFNTRAHKS